MPPTETAVSPTTGLRVAYVMQNVGVNLAAEVGQEPGIVVFSFVPGLTRTRLQEELLALDEDRFPDVRRFRRWHAMGAAKEPERVAEILEAVLAGPRDGLNGSVVDAEEFERERRRALLGTR